MRKYCLLVICHGFPPYYGGAEHAAYFLAREAAASGDVEVTVLTSDIGGRLPAEETMDGFRVVRARGRKKEWTRHTVFELASFLRAADARLQEVVTAHKPDAVLAHFSLPAGELARRIKRRWGIPYTVVLHGSDVPGFQPKRFAMLYPFVRPVVRRIWREADHVVAVGQGLRGLARATWPKGAGGIEVIENGVDTKLFHPGSQPTAREGGDFQIVVIAQLIERKGIQYLLEALSQIRQEGGPRCAVHVCGTGPYEPMLRAKTAAFKLEDQVHFRGLLPHEDLAELLRRSDVFVLPSLQEGLPLSLLEAMATGLPVVATRVGGIPTVLRHGTDALLVDPADSQQLQKALATLIQDSELRRRLGANARDMAVQHGWGRVWADYARVMGLYR